MARNDFVERHRADGGPRQIEAVNYIFELGSLAPGDRNACVLGATSKPHSNTIDDLRVGPIDRNVINKGYRLCAEANQIIHIHRNAIDTYCIVLFHHPRDNRLRPHSIGTDGEAPAITDIYDVGKISDLKPDATEVIGRQPSTPDPFDEASETNIGLVGVDARIPVGRVRCNWITRCHGSTLVQCADIAEWGLMLQARWRCPDAKSVPESPERLSGNSSSARRTIRAIDVSSARHNATTARTSRLQGYPIRCGFFVLASP